MATRDGECSPGFRSARCGCAGRRHPVRFLVAQPDERRTHGDSYVLTLEDDPAAIAHARKLIARDPSACCPIVEARIAAGSDGINRDLLATALAGLALLTAARARLRG